MAELEGQDDVEGGVARRRLVGDRYREEVEGAAWSASVVDRCVRLRWHRLVATNPLCQCTGRRRIGVLPIVVRIADAASPWRRAAACSLLMRRQASRLWLRHRGSMGPANFSTSWSVGARSVPRLVNCSLGSLCSLRDDAIPQPGRLFPLRGAPLISERMM